MKGGFDHEGDFSMVEIGQRHASGQVLAAALWLFSAGTAHAALFDDDEARRQIAALRTQAEASQKTVNERLGTVDQRLSAIEAAVQDRRALIDLAAALDALKQDIARL